MNRADTAYSLVVTPLSLQHALSRTKSPRHFVMLAMPQRTLMLFCCVFSRAEAESWTKLGADIDGEVAGERTGISVSLSVDGRRLARVGAPYNGGNAESANVVGAVAGARLVAIGAGTGVVLALAYVALNRRIKAQRSPALEPRSIGIALSGNNGGGRPAAPQQPQWQTVAISLLLPLRLLRRCWAVAISLLLRYRRRPHTANRRRLWQLAAACSQPATATTHLQWWSAWCCRV